MTSIKVDEVQIVPRFNSRFVFNDSHARKTTSILEDDVYPFRL